MSLSFANNTLSMTSQDIDFTLEIIFVTNEMSDDMKMAYSICSERFEEILKVITEEECQNLPKEKLKNDKKKKIFLFEEFDEKNAAFNYIYRAETVHIFGIRCMLTVLLDGVTTPEGSYHICNLAMRNVVVTATNLNKEEKKELKRLVSFMGGRYIENLTDIVTHLVSNSVSTMKYEIAAQNKVAIMHPDWVKNVWKKSQNIEVIVRAVDSQFESYKLPIFFNLCFTSTGLKVNDRNTVKTLVEENGGRYNASFTINVDILIMEEESIGSAKFKAATKLKKLCLTPAWVNESVSSGYALPIAAFNLGNPLKATSSTPTKNSDGNLTIGKFNPDNTQLSDISRTTAAPLNDISLCETVASRRSTRQNFLQPIAGPSKMSMPMPGPSKMSLPGTAGPSKSSLPGPSKSSLAGPSKSSLRTPPGNSQTSVATDISPPESSLRQLLRDAKKVGDNILDGCSIVLMGFSVGDAPILNKVLSVLGATITDTVSEQVTHVITGKIDQALFEDLEEHHLLVKVGWLFAVVANKAMVDVAGYEIPRDNEKPVMAKPSPASKRAMKSMSSVGVFKKPEIPKLQLENDEEELDLVNQYLEPNQSSIAEQPSMGAKFLTGKYVFIYGYNDTTMSAAIIEEVEKLGATLVDETYRQPVDYVITAPGIIDELSPPVRYKNIVSDMWIEDSVAVNECAEIAFYHTPIPRNKDHEKPLKDEIFVVTNYKGNGRYFITFLVNNLGGECKEVMRKADCGILISPNEEGKKFDSAKLWNWTVLSVEWLVECQNKKWRVDETPFLIGGTGASRKNRMSPRKSIVPSSQEIEDYYDPPIENVADNEPIKSKRMSTPKTPGTPNFNVERLVEGMPTPQRQDTLAVLLENQRKNAEQKRMQAIMTPVNRVKMMTDNAKDSPRPEIPSCMKPIEKDYGIRPNSTPNSQAFHKRKLEGLDLNYVEPAEKKRSIEKEEPTPPYAHRRYDFYKQRVPFFNSPDPRVQPAVDPEAPIPETQCILPVYANRELNYEEEEAEKVNGDETESFRDIQRFVVKKPKLKPKSVFEQVMEEEPSRKEEPMYAASEQMVEWAEVEPMEESQQQKKRYIFSFTGINENREEITRNIQTLGGIIDHENFTILLTEKPNRGEKFMLALSRGCFVLHTSFINKSYEEGKFVAEDEFEFGNPKFDACEFTQSNEFKAPYKWRQWIKVDYPEIFTEGAFSGKTFIIVSNTKFAQFSTIIKGGGGTVLEVNPNEIFNSQLIKRERVYQCFYEVNSMKKENLEILKQCKVAVHKLSYLYEHFMSQSLPQ